LYNIKIKLYELNEYTSRILDPLFELTTPHCRNREGYTTEKIAGDVIPRAPSIDKRRNYNTGFKYSSWPPQYVPNLKYRTSEYEIWQTVTW
jgi:hypothetical protein